MTTSNKNRANSSNPAHRKPIFPHYFTSKVTDKSTGQTVDHTFECQGTAYIAEKTGLPERTVRWRAKQGYIPNAKRMGINNHKRIIYFWLTEQANAYIESIKPKVDLYLSSNDENYTPYQNGGE